MRGFRSHAGSALLVVLGLLVFVTTSAIAFSVYMRQQRLPSSMSRRTATSRQLVKAALARAITEINRENVIGDSPLTKVGIAVNSWKNRIYMPTTSMTRSGTHPVLTLEGLAYLPPNLVNDVRYYSQFTPSAEWHVLPFDVGRYAFVAVDVTDYLDVNKLVAGSLRSSSPNLRLSIAHVFENDDHSGLDKQRLDQWDKFMESFRDVDYATGACSFESKVPLVSLADFNLALHAKDPKNGVAGFVSPFCRYVSGVGGQVDSFYDETVNGGREIYRRMTFVTDSLPPRGMESRAWKSPDGDYEPYYDLTKESRQPFKMSDLDSGSYPQVAKIMNYSSNRNAMERFQESIPLLSKVALWDYLDTDRVPASLAVPTVEKNAMVCGVQLVPDANATLQTVSARTEENVGTTDKGGTTVRRTDIFGIDAKTFGNLVAGTKLRTVLAYPFNHPDVNDPEFDVDVRVAYYFALNDGGSYIPIRSEMDAGSSGLLDYSRTPDLTENNSQLSEFESSFEKSAFVVQFKSQPISFPKNESAKGDTYGVGTEYLDAVWPYVDTLTFLPGGTTLAAEITAMGEDVNVASGAGAGNYKIIPFVKIVTEWERDSKGNPAEPPADAAKTIETPAFGLVKKDNTAFDVDAIKEAIEKGSFNPKFRLETAVWTRVKMDDEVLGDDQVVDLAPAGVLDDDKQRSGSSSGKGIVQIMEKIGEGGAPLLKFVSSKELTVTLQGQSGAALTPVGTGPQIFKRTTAFVADPRYNHAPENWFTDAFADDDEANLAQKWISVNGAKNVEGDIFMAVSDQGWLQSIYEMAFLPCLSAGGIAGFRQADNPDVQMFGDLALHVRQPGQELPDQFSNTKDNALAWNSYCPYEGADDFNDFGFCSEGAGLHVSPYSDETNVLYSVFANTPLNWSLAYTNNPDIVDMDVKTFNEKYAYCDYNAAGFQLSWVDVNSIVEKIGGTLRAGYSNDIYDWEKVWREKLDWELDTGDLSRFLGLDLNPKNYRFTSADRKFLYGYWHDCFGVGQQLYLLFVRCEPMMMGSDSADRVPPQLGTRVVALVWRDAHSPKLLPTAPDTGAPHRTRVLFYRQLD